MPRQGFEVLLRIIMACKLLLRSSEDLPKGKKRDGFAGGHRSFERMEKTMSDLFGNEFQVLARSLDFSAERNNLIAANIANADTPGYKAVRINFEKTLQQMVSQRDEVALQRTDPKHFPMDPAAGTGRPEITLREESLKRDGNSVNMDEEVARMSMNQIRYNAGAEVLNNLFKNLEYAIQEGGQ